MANENEQNKAEQNQDQNKGGGSEQDPIKQKVEQLERENASLLKETLAKKQQIKELEEKKTQEEQERLKEQNRYKELYEAGQPQVKRLGEIEPVLNQILETEIAGVPEDKRELIPQFEKPEQKLLWVRQAKDKGLFTPNMDGSRASTGADGKPVTVGSKVNTDKNLPDFVNWSSTDPRLMKLTTQEFQVWKRHSQRTVTGIKGWGNG